MLTTAGVIGAAGLTAAAGLGSSVLGAAINKRASDYAAKKAAEAQEKVNAEQIAFAREQNEITRQREDNAHQREVTDLRNAGLSPLGSMSGASASTGLNADLSSEGFTRAAEIQAAGAQGFGNALQSSVGNFAQAVGNYTQLKNAQVGETVGNSVAAYNQSKTDETDINNSTLAAMNADKLLELEEKIRNLKKRNVIDGAKADKAEEFVDAEIESMSQNASNARSQAALHDQKYKFNEEDAVFFNDLGLPKDTSVSLSASTPIGYGQVTGRNLWHQSHDKGGPLKPRTGEPDLLKVAQQTAKSEASSEYSKNLAYLKSVVEKEKQALRESNKLTSSEYERAKEAYDKLKSKSGKAEFYGFYYSRYGLTEDGKRFAD